MEIVVLPHFWQTRWFQGAGMLVLAAAVFVAYRQRIVRLERRRAAQQRVTQQILLSQENERKRVASELHDGVSQNATLLALGLDVLCQRLPPPDECLPRLQEFSAQAHGLSAELHRISHGLHPAKLAQLGLAVAVRNFCREVETAQGIAIDFTAGDVPRALPAEIALCLYRVSQEAIQNVVKHSHARSAQVDLTTVDGAIQMTITDDGRGFDLGARQNGGSLGLVSMTERVKLVHGEIVIESNPGKGTQIKVRVPLPTNVIS